MEICPFYDPGAPEGYLGAPRSIISNGKMHDHFDLNGML